MNHNKKLPKNWNWVKLGEVAEYLNGRGFKKAEWETTGLPIIRIQNLNKDTSAYNYTTKIFEDKYKVKNGDLLFAWSASLGTYIWKGQEAWLNQHIFKIVPKHFCDKMFLFYSLEKIISELYSKTHGSGMIHVTKSKFEATLIPLPPIKTQQAIVSKIEELFSELDKGIEDLKTTQQQLKIYRQSVLKWAFEGRLTNKKVKDGELPKGWELKKFGKLFSESPQNGLYKSSTQYGEGTPIIRIDGFYDGVILNNYKIKKVRLTDEEIERYLISVGDILINRVNSMPYLGKCGLVKHLSERTVFESNIMKIRVNNEFAIPEFISKYLTSKKGLIELRKNAKQAVNQASINQTDVSNVLVPVPQRDEQFQIVQEIESRLSVADKIEESIAQSLQQAESLRQSILKKAFTGELI